MSYGTYCLQATLKKLTRSKACGLTPRQIFHKMKKRYMVDVKIPTTDGREIVMQCCHWSLVRRTAEKPHCWNKLLPGPFVEKARARSTVTRLA